MTQYVWSIDDAGMGGRDMVEALVRTTDFLTSRGLLSTWFVVPKAHHRPLTDAWRRALTAAHDAGHDLQLHGLTHANCYEFGPPIWPATSILSTLQTEFDQHRLEMLSRYTVPRLRARIEEGMALFTQALDVEPTLFRAPCGAISKAMFAALQEVGIKFHTCMYISGTGYQHLPHNSGVVQQDWVTTIPYHPYHWYHGIIEVPILNEYTWHGAGARSVEFIDLACRDVDRIQTESPVAVILMHTHGIADDYDHTFRILDAVTEHIGKQPGASFTTLGALAASGVLEQAATVTGPDILEI